MASHLGATSIMGGSPSGLLPVRLPNRTREEIERNFAQGERSILAQLPTGGGKTVVASEIIRRHELSGVLFIAHRSETIDQTSEKLTANGVHHGIIQSGKDERLRPMARVQVASIQTLHARAIRSNAMELPLAGLIIIDEAHHAPAMTYTKVLQRYPNAKVLGLTATPCRGDGRGLGGIFDRLIIGLQVSILIEKG